MFKHERAKQLLEAEGRTRKWVAQQLGLTPGTLNQYLAGFQRPGRETIANMAKLFQVEISQLEDEPETNEPVPTEANVSNG